MRTRGDALLRGVAWLAFVVTFAGRPGPVSAEAAAGARVASRHFQAGLKHYDAGDFARAVEEFRLAHEQEPNPKVLYNLALSESATGLPLSAVEHFREYLAATDGTISAMHREAVLGRICDETRRLAQVEVRIEPTEAKVALDGIEVNQGEPLLVVPGRHVINARSAGFRARSLALTLDAGERQVVAVGLERVPDAAWILVECPIPDVEVRLGGSVLGVTPLLQPLRAPSGRRRVGFPREGYSRTFRSWS